MNNKTPRSTSMKVATDDNFDRLYSPQEVAKILNVSTRTVYRYIWTGQIGFIKYGTEGTAPIRIPRKKIDLFLTKAESFAKDSAR